MIKSIIVTNHLDEAIKLELRKPMRSGFLIQEITGLGPPKATINTTETASGDGTSFNSSRIGTRNIVFTLKFLEKPTIEHVRQLSYQYFPIKKRITMLFETNNRVCKISGYIESNETVIFSDSVGTQISVICPNPYFLSALKNTKRFYGLDSLFEFPFSNESLTESLINFGEVNDDVEDNIWYSGDVDVGVVLTIYSTGEARNVTIYNNNTREKMFIDTERLKELTGDPILQGDEIRISTVMGEKGVTLTRQGVTTNILNCLSRDSDWLKLAKGDNIFSYTAEYGIQQLQFKIENNILYEGL